MTADFSRGDIKTLFDVDFDKHNGIWDGLWQKQEKIFWDRLKPNPALVDALNERQHLLGAPVDAAADSRRKVALVPGCGRGYDVLLLAARGYDAYGLDVSENAIQLCWDFAREHADEYKSMVTSESPGSYHFVRGDFFKDDWLHEHGLDVGSIDFIYDYTFFCALPPEMRPAWALRMSQLLKKPSGKLVCLEFPTWKDPATKGPPFGLSPDVYVAHLSQPGEELPYNAEGYPDKTAAERHTASALERIAHWRPERTHAAGQGTDFMSVWQHK